MARIDRAVRALRETSRRRDAILDELDREAVHGGGLRIVGRESELDGSPLRPGERIVNGIRLYSAAWIDDNEPTPPIRLQDARRLHSSAWLVLAMLVAFALPTVALATPRPPTPPTRTPMPYTAPVHHAANRFACIAARLVPVRGESRVHRIMRELEACKP